jgi:hypothetical protein
MPEICGKLTFRPNLCDLITYEKNWVREEDRWEIILGPRGSQNHFGTGVAKAAA